MKSSCSKYRSIIWNYLRQYLADQLFRLSSRCWRYERRFSIAPEEKKILVFFSEENQSFSTRTMNLAEILKKRGYRVILSGDDRCAAEFRKVKFDFLPVESPAHSQASGRPGNQCHPISRHEGIDRCVQSERRIMHQVDPDMVIHYRRPTVSVSARLESRVEVEIIHGYEQPDYPYPLYLPEYIHRTTDPYKDYLADHIHSFHPHKKYHLICDIPELFPPPLSVFPGTYYIGPLLDLNSINKKRKSKERARGRNTILLVLPASDLLRNYFKNFIEIANENNCDIAICDDHASIRDTHTNTRTAQLTEARLSSADLVVGSPDSCVLYKAIYLGIPILGIPEDIDQEYSFNRIQELGLGKRIDRCDLSTDSLFRIIQKISDEYPDYSGNSRKIDKAISNWNTGFPLVDAIDQIFISENHISSETITDIFTEDEFIHYIDISTPERLSKNAIRQILRQNVSAIPHINFGKSILYDRVEAWNWLYNNSPSFFETDYRSLEEKRQFFFSKEKSIKSKKDLQIYRIKYLFKILPGQLNKGDKIAIYLPFPIANEQQKVISLLSCEPAKMRDNWLPRFGYFYNLQLVTERKDMPLHAGYECEIEIKESHADMRQFQSLKRSEYRRYLELEKGYEKLPETVLFQKRIADRQASSELEKISAIYEYFVENIRFQKTRDHSQSYTCCTTSVLNRNAGHCIAITRAFIGLCRMNGIPAREVCGALIGYPLQDGLYEQQTYQEPVFGHTWAEVFIDRTGWFPVEFHGIVIGERAMTKDNIEDHPLKQIIIDNTQKYRDYYFGSIDNQRVICSNSVHSIPQFLVERTEADENLWKFDPRIRYECILTTQCA